MRGYSKSEIIIQIIMNILCGISIFYYFFKIGDYLNHKDVLNIIILFVFTLKFIVDVYFFKISFASFSLLVLFMPIFSILAFGPSGEVQPLFNSTTHLIEKHFYVLVFSALYFYCVWSILLFINKKTFKEFDSGLLQIMSKTSRLSTYLFSCLALVGSVIYLPDLPGKPYHDLSGSLLPGNAWNMVVIISYYFVLTGVKNSKLRRFTLIFVPVWFLTHYARVDILGLLLLWYLIFSLNNKNNNLKLGKKFVVVMIITFCLISFSYLGLTRHSGIVFSYKELVTSMFAFLNYPTVQDILYSTAAAIEVNERLGNVNTLINIIPQLLPSYLGLPMFQDAAKFVASNIHTNYGMLIYGEYYLNYKLFGVFLAPFITYIVLFVPLSVLQRFFGKIGKTLGYFLIVMTVTRSFWYGYIYYIKPLIIIVPIFLITHIIVSGVEKNIVGERKNSEKLINYPLSMKEGR